MKENIKMKKYYVYKIVCKKNNVSYFGRTQNADLRKYQHFTLLKNKAHSSPSLQKDYNRYGEKSFQFDIISVLNTKLKAHEKEIELIKSGIKNRNCYNVKIDNKLSYRRGVSKDAQVTIRITLEDEEKIKIVSDKMGLTKASWMRMVIIDELRKVIDNA
jgi:group I intron endonuclease